MRKCFLLLICLLSTSLYAIDLKFCKDSLIKVLNETPKQEEQRRLELLNNILDVELAMGENSHIYECWDLALKLKDYNSMDDIIVPLELKFLGDNKLDSIAKWVDYNNQYMPANRAAANNEYLELMRDIRAWKDYEALSKKLIDEKISLDKKNEPYKAMRILYTLGVIADFVTNLNPKLNLKPGEEYLLEALDIANSLSYEDGFRFKRQILLFLSSKNLKYAQMFLNYTEEYLNQPHLKNRKFYSRRNLLLAYEKILIFGNQLSRNYLDMYYNQIMTILKHFSHDASTAPSIFKARVSLRYFKTIGDYNKSLTWCDTLIKEYKQRNMDNSFYVAERFNLLGKLKNWEEGYKCSVELMALKDSINNASSEKKIQELQTLHGVDALKRKEEKQKYQLISLIILVIFIVIIFAIYFVYQKKTKMKNKVLLSQLYNLVEKLKEEQKNAQTSNVTSLLPDSNDLNNSNKEDISNENSEIAVLFTKIETILTKDKLYLDPNCNRDMLVDRLGTNKNKLSEILSKSKGLTINEYINDLRLKESLLIMEKDKNMPLSDVAIMSGFGVYSSFYRAFCKSYGVKPTEYRSYVN